MSEMIAKFMIKYRYFYLIIIILITGFFIYKCKDVRISHSVEGSAPQDHPYVKLNKKMGDIFGGANLVAIGVVVKEGDIFNLETLKKVYSISERVRELRGAVPYRITSIASRRFSRVWITPDDIYEGIQVNSLNLLRDLEQVFADPEHLAVYRDGVLRNDFIYGAIVSRDKKGTAILGDFNWLKDYRYIFKELKKIAKEYTDSNTDIYIGGNPVTLGYIHTYMGKIFFIFGLAIAIMCLLLFIAFRKIIGMALPLLAGMISVVWALGLMEVFRYKLDLMSITVPFLILAVTVSHSVQVVKRFLEEYHESENKVFASERAISTLLVPALAAIVTDNIGLIGLYFLPFEMMKSVVLVGRFGIFSIFFTCTLFIPILLSILPKPKIATRKVGPSFLDKIMSKIADLTSQKGSGAAILAISAIIFVISLVGLSKVRPGDTKPGAPEFWQDSPYNRDLAVLNERFTGVNPFYIYVNGKYLNALYDPKIIADMDALQTYLEKRPDVKSTISIADKIKKINESWHFGDKEYPALPQTRQETAFMINSLIHQAGGEESRAFFEWNVQEAAIQVFATDHKRETVMGLIEGTKKWLKENKKSDADFEVAGGIIGIYASIIEVIEKSLYESIVIVGISIFMVVAICFRSIIIGLLLLCPLAIGMMFTYAVMGFGDIGLFLPTLPVGAIGMGVGIDYAIYVFARIRTESKEAKDLKECFQRALTTSGEAVIFTALSLTGGIFVLYLSDLRFQALMGLLLAVVFLSSLVATLFTFTSLIAWLKPKSVFGEAKWIKEQK